MILICFPRICAWSSCSSSLSPQHFNVKLKLLDLGLEIHFSPSLVFHSWLQAIVFWFSLLKLIHPSLQRFLVEGLVSVIVTLKFLKLRSQIHELLIHLIVIISHILHLMQDALLIIFSIVFEYSTLSLRLVIRINWWKPVYGFGRWLLSRHRHTDVLEIILEVLVRVSMIVQALVLKDHVQHLILIRYAWRHVVNPPYYLFTEAH